MVFGACKTVLLWLFGMIVFLMSDLVELGMVRAFSQFSHLANLDFMVYSNYGHGLKIPKGLYPCFP